MSSLEGFQRRSLVAQGFQTCCLCCFIEGKKKSDTQRLRWWKEMFCLLVELALTSVTFSSAPHRFSLFFILSGYKSACEMRDLLVPGSPLRLNLFTDSVT